MNQKISKEIKIWSGAREQDVNTNINLKYCICCERGHRREINKNKFNINPLALVREDTNLDCFVDFFKFIKQQFTRYPSFS